MKRRLARKEYLAKALPIIENNIKVLSTALTGYQTITPEYIINKMSAISVQRYRSMEKSYSHL